MTLLAFPRTLPPRHEAVGRAPQTLEETGLAPGFLVELLAKAMYRLGLSRLTELGTALCLSGAVVESLALFMRREGLLEVAGRGANDADVRYDLTGAGAERAASWIARNQYAGPAPVPLEQYCERVRAQSVAGLRTTRPAVEEAFAGEVLPPRLRDLLGTALNAHRAILLHGEPGAGKTWLARRLHRLLGGTVAIPHAICVDGEVVRVYDPHWHQAVPDSAAAGGSPLDNRTRPDARWVSCMRPLVSSGGELSMEMLDLSFDARAGYYEAPPHFKANNGLFVVDDLGRQLVSVQQLLNRWIVPMEHRVDHLMLRTGAKFAIPFDLVLVFSTNLRPEDLRDDAFLRRLGHKIDVGALSRDDYRVLFERACGRFGLEGRVADCLGALERLYARDGRSRLASHPHELAHLVASRCAYLEAPGAADPAAFEWAWKAFFATPDPVSGDAPAAMGEDA